MMTTMIASATRSSKRHGPIDNHSGRQRWLVREVDADSGEATTSWQFTDYHGEQPYLDYDVEFDFEADPPTADAYDSMRYLPGQSPDREGGVVHAQQAASNGAARYYHGDLTGSTNALTDTSGAMLTGGTTTNGGPFYYTSFGERVYYDTSSSSWKLGGEFPIGSPRYMYDGGHGYEAGHLALSGANSSLAPITFQHVGERWYQPDIGRFVQRDPIGLGGGLNVYAYCASSPVAYSDPSGLYWDFDDIRQADGSTLRHFYDRGCFGWVNDYQYTVHVPAGSLPPRPPRTPDQRVKSVVKATLWGCYSGMATGAVRGAIGGAAEGPPGVLIGGVAGGILGSVVGTCGGFISGIANEALTE